MSDSSRDESVVAKKEGESAEPRVAISIVVPCYNDALFLLSCLESIYTHAPSRRFETIVVDDASSDATAELVQERFSQVRLLVNETNQGYARSTNRGIAASRGEYIYLLNSDVQVLPDAIDALVEVLETNERAAAAASLLYNGDGSIQSSIKALPSARSALFGARSTLSRWWPDNRFTRKELLHWKAESGEPFTAGYVSSASLMVRKDVFEKIGELDTAFFYFLDADFCKRIWDADLEVYCVPAGAVIHHAHHGGSMVSLSRRLRGVGNFHLGAYRYFRKHASSPVWHPLHLITLLGLGARFAVSGSIQLLREMLGVDRRFHREARPLTEEQRRDFHPQTP